MKALLYKDFLVMWKQLKAFLLIVTIFCLLPNQTHFMNQFFVIYAGLMIPISLISYDERAAWNSFSVMLPYTSRDIVLSRYVTSWLCSLFAAAMYAIGSVWDTGNRRLADLIWILALLLLLQSILFPFLFRIGVEKARLYMFFICLIIVVLSAGLVALGSAALPQESPLLLLGYPAVFVLALLLSLASVPLSIQQHIKSLG